MHRSTSGAGFGCGEQCDSLFRVATVRDSSRNILHRKSFRRIPSPQVTLHGPQSLSFINLYIGNEKIDFKYGDIKIYVGIKIHEVKWFT